MNRKLLGLSLSTLMILAGNVSADCDEIGYFDCGTTGDVKWYLSNDKTTLIFSGEGATADYAGEEVNPYYGVDPNTRANRRTDAPWKEYVQTVTNIEVSEGVTRLGQAVAMGFEHVTNVSLPSTLESLGESAFNRAYGLTQINLPNSLKQLDEGAFWGSGLTSVVLPDSVTVVGKSAFKANQNLQAVIIPDTVQTVGSNAFALTTTVYCPSAGLCTGKGTENVVTYDKQGGVYMIGDKYYTSLENMQNDISRASNDTTDYTCGTNLNECKRAVLEAKGICQGSACDTFIQSDGQYMLKFGGKTYQSINDLLKGNYDRRRIYTVEEANFVAGERNTVTIRYR